MVKGQVWIAIPFLLLSAMLLQPAGEARPDAGVTPPDLILPVVTLNAPGPIGGIRTGRPHSAPGGRPPFAVDVTQHSPFSGLTSAAPNSTDSVYFKVTNTGSIDDLYSLTCSRTGGVTCGTVTPSTLDLLGSEFGIVKVTYSMGTTPGTLTLTATGTATDQAFYTVSTAPTVNLVVPILTSGSRAVVRNRQPVIRALFMPQGSDVDTTKTVLKLRSDTVTLLARANRGLIEWEVDSARWIPVGDSAQITVTACAVTNRCTTVTRWAVLPNDSKPVLGFTGVPLEALGRQFAAPFGPDLSVVGAEIETGISTPAYFSMGKARSAGLVYSTRQSYPRALVPVDLELTWPVGTPDQIKLILKEGAVKLDSLVLSSPTCATGATRRCRAVLQGDYSASSFATPTRKWLTVEAQITSGGTLHSAADSVEVVIVDRRSTPYGSGWWPTAFLKVVQAGADRLLIAPNGSATIYRGNGDSLFLSPPGDFVTLTKLGSSGWRLTPRGSSAFLQFDSNGRLEYLRDQNSNRDSVKYNASTDEVTSLKDAAGKSTAFTYASGKLTTITDPGSRQTKVTIDGGTNQLTYDSIPSPTSAPYTARFVYQGYSGTNTNVLTKVLGVILDTTVVTYDSTFKRRPTQVTLPRVQDETGSNVTPVIAYTPIERQGFGSLRALDSAYVELKDPRNNWTRSLVNRWGLPRYTWDALGTLGRADYTAEGFLRWNEGKVADSSRIYHAYDSQMRFIKSFIVRASNDTLRSDSLVYDSNHRVIKRVSAWSVNDPLGEYTYDGNGNLTKSKDANGDSTVFWYRSDGLVDSTRLPDQTVARRFTYDGTWKNLAIVTLESGEVGAAYGYDGYGRRTNTEGRIAVRRTSTDDVVQWRRSVTGYSITNQLQSTTVTYTEDCIFEPDPEACVEPDWPEASDTIRNHTVSFAFDRGGRDSLRLTDRGIATLYLYDRLGRVVSRRPWTDSTAVRDSLVYDIAGNLKKVITRRGDTITTNFDSRNRDTLMVIPTIGTVRRAFSGPLDQPTRIWVENALDSIGGINPELRWGFDQRGRVKADTSYTGAVARSTSYSYDTYERIASNTNALGTTTFTYELFRGYPTGGVTPYSDTISYKYDTQTRATGPIVSNGGKRYHRLVQWNATGALELIRDSVPVGSPYVVGKWDRVTQPDSANPPLAPVWTEARSSGGSTDSLRDSLSYDGWERVAAVVMTRNNSVVQRDTFRFNRTGDILTTAGAEVYHPVTGRLTQRSDGGSTWSYLYDRAGNLIRAIKSGTNDTLTYGYDALNRLVSLRKNGTGLVARYAYDLAGRRIAKRVYSNATGGTVAYTRFVHHGNHVAYETDSAGTIGLRYTWGLDVDDLVAVRDGSGNHFYAVQDPLRSVRGLVKQDGTWTRSLRYGAYGAAVKDTAASGAPSWDLRYRWTGRERDAELGWYYFRARYYDEKQRRFVQEDPIGFAGGPNVYAYVGGRPFALRDPFGLDGDCGPGKAVCLAPVVVYGENPWTLVNSAIQASMLAYYLSNLFGNFSTYQSPREGTWGIGPAISGGGGGGGSPGTGGTTSTNPMQPAPAPQSCDRVEFAGTSGVLSVQTNPENGYVQWEIHTYNIVRNAGPWI